MAMSTALEKVSLRSAPTPIPTKNQSRNCALVLPARCRALPEDTHGKPSM